MSRKTVSPISFTKAGLREVYKPIQNPGSEEELELAMNHRNVKAVDMYQDSGFKPQT